MGELVSLGIGSLYEKVIAEPIYSLVGNYIDQRELNKLLADIQDREIQFEQQNDGSIATSSSFYSCIKNYNIIGDIVSYVLFPESNTVTAEEFKNNTYTKMQSYLEEKNAKKFSYDDERIVKKFIEEVFLSAQCFLNDKIPKQLKGMLYYILQMNAAISELHASVNDVPDHMEKISHLQEALQREIQTKFDIQLEILQKIYKQLQGEDFNPEINSKKRIMDWNSRQIKNLGNRYMPDINVPLSLSRTLESLALNDSFSKHFWEETDKFLISVKKQRFSKINPIIEKITDYVLNICFFEFKKENVKFILDQLKALETLLDAHKSEKERYSIYRLYNAIACYKEFLESSEVTAASTSYLLLVGDGGVGKSHLIADFVSAQSKIEKTSVLLLGQQFKVNDPFSEIAHIFEGNNGHEKILQIFENIACGQKSRFIIAIDALNEGAGVRYWNQELGGMLEELRRYPHIGLIISVRTQYEKQLFDEHDEARNSFCRIVHTGFSEVMHEGIQKYFSFYGVENANILAINTEFRNPLFLRMFCAAHTNKRICNEDLSLPNVYQKYIEYIENQISGRCDYHPSLHLVQMIMDELVEERLKTTNTALRLPILDVHRIIAKISREWNIGKDVYTALINEGVLTQALSYDDEEYVYITYERLEDYFIARKIIKEFNATNKEKIYEKYRWILNKPDLLTYIFILYSEEHSAEFLEVVINPNSNEKMYLREAFLESLIWRKNTAINEGTFDYINSEILLYEHSFTKFVDTLFGMAMRTGSQLNAVNSFNFFESNKMPSRDEVFIPIFDELYDQNETFLSNILSWCLDYSNFQNINGETIQLTAIILCWLLITSNNEIRNKATKGLVSLLCGHYDELLQVMRKFEKIDDPYVIERIYAVAFGCAVNEKDQDKSGLRNIALYVYTAIFKSEEVYPNILLRNYAKNIIDYSLYLKVIDNDEIDIATITPPYNSKFPEIPSDIEIEGFYLNPDDPSFEPHYYSQLSILHSMQVEYSRDGQPGGYGDFGRYIFESYFSKWPQLDPNDLKNIAIKRIFTLGYDVKKHGYYDMLIVRYNYQTNKERIGKKYQWIALYELAAQVKDNYQLKIKDYLNDTEVKITGGSYEPNIRDIDPQPSNLPRIVKSLPACDNTLV